MFTMKNSQKKDKTGTTLKSKLSRKIKSKDFKSKAQLKESQKQMAVEDEKFK